MTSLITAASVLLYFTIMPSWNQSSNENETLDQVLSPRFTVPMKITAETKPMLPPKEAEQKKQEKFSAVFAESKETRTDTITAGASKDWIAGYQAAMNYRDYPPTERFMIEQSLANSRTIDSNRSTIKSARTEAENKIRIERELQKQRRIID